MAAQTRNLKLGSCLRAGGLLAAVACCPVLGCVSTEAELPPVRSADAIAGEKVLCVDDFVRSIWKGQHLGGPGCADPSAYADQHDPLVRGRIERVCEHTEIRTILSGEPSSRFTREACASHAQAYEQATIARACNTASRALKANEEEFNDAQAVACEKYLPAAPARLAARVAAKSDQLLATRTSNFASVERAPEGVADNALARFFRNARGKAGAGSGVPAVAPAVATGAPASNAPDLATCEDRYIESIWRGRDLSGPECAGYIDADGSTPRYRRARIQNVCDGAAIQAMRRGEPATPFAQQACAGALRARTSPAPMDCVRAAADPPPPGPSGRGLSEEEIAQAVDANWRSIGRDCMSVAPASGSQAHTSTQISVTMTVSPVGQVRDASARAGGRRRELESCVEDSVRGWRFPAASADTVVAFPFTFVGQ
jgi:hypothetical protein